MRARRLPTLLIRIAYQLVSYALTPVLFGFLLWRGLASRGYWQRLPERFGFVPPIAGPCLWVHAVSVGEVQASAPLVRELLARYPQYRLLVTTTTPTGAERVRGLFGDAVDHAYVPYDLWGSVQRFFQRTSPSLAIIIETELWPNLFHACGRRGVPLVLASARISPRSVRKYRLFVSLFREALSHGIVIGAQSAADAERFHLLGAPRSRTAVTGNIKFDFELPEKVVTEGRRWRAENAFGRPVLVAASTHEGEEARVLKAFETLRERTGCLLIVVPRHPERFDGVAELLSAGGYRFARRSRGEHCSADTDVYLVDTMGELPAFYAASDVAFVGGSLVPVGGHNLLEPAVLGTAIITGPHTFNAEDVADKLIGAGAAVKVADQHELVETAAFLLTDPQACRQMAAAGRVIVAQNRGAVGALLDLVAPLLSATASAPAAERRAPC
jgi:3-deoxy-D-manno-octulosonic-acid transferase